MKRRYPLVEINTGTIRNNARVLRELCNRSGISPYAVIKGFNGIPEVVGAIAEAGYDTVGSSRLRHLREARKLGLRTLAVRIPMPSEVPDIVELCDISLNSQLSTIELLNEEAARRRISHNVILMRDLGDLREGIFDRTEMISAAVQVEQKYKNIHLLGLGANLSCYGTVMPTATNLAELVSNAEEIESRIGRKLEVVSGGASTTINPLLHNEVPKGINNIRIGTALLYRAADDLYLEDGELTELDYGFTMRAEVVEIGCKPTRPLGRLGLDCFGNPRTFEDHGTRRRIVLAVGAFDIGNHDKILPHDKKAYTLGCSSDHLIVDVHDSDADYRVGDVVPFSMCYQSILFATENPNVEKIIV